MIRESIVHFSPALRSLWPSPLAAQWASHYPELFDNDDLRIALRQPRNHFAEWLAAIHLFHRDGVLSLVEKYSYSTHLRKLKTVQQLLADNQRDVLQTISSRCGVQLPDLLVFNRDQSAFWFAEVKGPGDRVREAQRLSHLEIVRLLGVPIELISVMAAGS